MLLLLLGSGGCALLPGSTVRETALHAPPAVKRDVYREVANTVADHRRQGNVFLSRGDYYRALVSYRQAAFYDQAPDLLRRIAELEAKVAEEGKRLFAEGQAAQGSDDEAALKAFNRVLRLNPEHLEARRARDRLLATNDRLQSELTARQEALRRSWETYSAQPGEIADLAEQSAAVLEYQSDNALAAAIEKQIDQQRQQEVRLYLEKGLDFYQNGEFEQARFFAQKARAIDPENPEVLSFLAEIRKDQDSTYFLNLARYRMEQGDLDKAEEYAGKALALDPGLQAAETIAQKARLARFQNALAEAERSFARGDYEQAMAHLQQVMKRGPHCQKWPELHESVREILEKEIPAMLDQAQKLFAENKLQQASALVTCVLDLDPENTMATTYLKKIQSRLTTIKSLQ